MVTFEWQGTTYEMEYHEDTWDVTMFHGADSILCIARAEGRVVSGPIPEPTDSLRVETPEFTGFLRVRPDGSVKSNGPFSGTILPPVVEPEFGGVLGSWRDVGKVHAYEKVLTSVQLVTAPNERDQCCVLDANSNRCLKASKYWVGTNGTDDYTYCCAEHLDSVRKQGDTTRAKGDGW